MKIIAHFVPKIMPMCAEAFSTFSEQTRTEKRFLEFARILRKREEFGDRGPEVLCLSEGTQRAAKIFS